jgi:ABC-type glycerol-3-phosphate transport system substrate-binding protein
MEALMATALARPVLLLAIALALAPIVAATTIAAYASPAQGAQSPAPSNMQQMMKMHEQMMAEMKAADSRLDALTKDMNAAKGDAKVNAIAAVVTELVQQQKSMHAHMGEMHQMMMNGMMMKK